MGPYSTTVLVAHAGYGPLLPPEDLVTAVQGHGDDTVPMARWARQISSLYLRWVAAPQEAPRLHQQIGDRITAIDAWVHGQLPRPLPGVPQGTDSIGGVVARVAEAWACAHWSLHHDDDKLQWHRAWDHFAEMRQGYEGLVHLALHSLIILPKSWPGLGWPGLDTRGEHRKPA